MSFDIFKSSIATISPRSRPSSLSGRTSSSNIIKI